MSEIKELRLKAGMTQKEMAEKFEMPLGTLVNWEQGRRNPPKWVEKLVLEKLREMCE